MTPERVIEAAMRLTAQQGLYRWGIRQLAAELDVWPTVIYHHVGDRDTVMDAVVDRVVSQMPCPSVDVPWRDWFGELLRGGRRTLQGYPGVARRLTLQGPTVPSALAIIDNGVQVLQKAGFGAQAAPMYSMLLNGAFLLVALDDDHDEAPETHQRAAEVLGAFSDDHDRPGLAAMGSYVNASKVSAEAVHGFNNDFYDYVIDCLLDAAEARLALISGKGRSADSSATGFNEKG
ncbi:TetR family transcriptional regulator [Streptomyces sp. NPDC050211]|uniref:TetR/AcrR family transcriptional regulator n=1 Tax=Streptomyces sp. NPDC050211 TaxID=3154932 RepID=UPI00343D83CC